MKALRVLAVAASLACLSIAASAPASDDPPPHPTGCPLCGGDPQVHVDKTFQVVETAARAAGLALRF